MIARLIEGVPRRALELLGALLLALIAAPLVAGDYLLTVLILIWFERKTIADMQTRVGPMRAGPRGILVTLADGIKLFFKEGITPTNVDRPVYALAPILAMFPAFLAFAVIPFGTGIHVFGRDVPFRLTNLSIGILWVLAMASLNVYGVVLDLLRMLDAITERSRQSTTARCAALMRPPRVPPEQRRTLSTTSSDGVISP